MGALPFNLGVFGVPSPEKKLRFQALKSAFWWILVMVLLWIMVKAKNPSGLIGGSGPPDPPPGSTTASQVD